MKNDMEKLTICGCLAFFVGVFIGCAMCLPTQKKNKSNVKVVNYIREGDRLDTLYATGNDLNHASGPQRIDGGVIPDDEAAARIAYEYVRAVFGEDYAINEQPYSISLLNNQIWNVCGSLKEGREGGTFSISIEKNTGKIHGIIHGK